MRQHLSQKSQPLAGDRVLIRGDVAPDADGAGDGRDRGRETLDDDEPVVADIAQRGGHGGPAHLPPAGHAAVVLAGVEVVEPLACLPDSLAGVALFQMHVEGVQMQAHVGAADGLDHRQPLLHDIDQVGLETVERFHRQPHAVVAGIGCQRPQLGHGQVALALAGVAVGGRGLAHRAIHRPADDGRQPAQRDPAQRGGQLGGGVDEAANVIGRGAALGGIGRHQIAPRPEHTAGQHAQVARRRIIRQRGHVDGRRILKGDLDEVKAHALDAIQQRQVGRRAKGRDEVERIDAEFHGFSWKEIPSYKLTLRPSRADSTAAASTSISFSPSWKLGEMVPPVSMAFTKSTTA